jgi:hypothetical protein
MKQDWMVALRMTRLIGTALGLAFYAISVYAQTTATTTNGGTTGTPAAPSTANGTAANSTDTPAAQFGAFYGGAAGNHDGTLRLIPRPSRSPLYSGQLQYRPANSSLAGYQQQYRSAFESAYRLAYIAALNHQQPQAVPIQTVGKTTASN